MHEQPKPAHRADLGGRAPWLVCLAVLLILGIANAAAAQGASDPPTASDPGIQLGEEELAEEECVEEVEELEANPAEAEEACEELDESEESGASACPLRSAHAHAAVQHERLKVTVGYMSSEPLLAKIQILAGAARAETFRRHLGRSGVLRFAEKVNEHHGNRVVVLIQATGAAECSARRLVLSLGA